MKLFGLFFIALFAFATTANAGILLEPYAGYSFGTTKAEISGSPTTDIKTTAVVLGGRVAGTFSMLFIGGDGAVTLSGKAKDNVSTDDFTGTTVYGVVGADLPVIRAWVGYGLMNSFKIDGTPETTYSGGTHIKAGIGFKLIPLVSINAEYFMDDFKKAKSGSTETAIPSAGGLQSLKGNTFMLSASVPFTF